MAFPDSLGGILDELAKLGSGKDYIERLKPLSIITADKKRYNLIFEDLELEGENKTSTYKFSEKQGSYTQNFGLGVVKYPLNCFFAGLQYDKIADAFVESLGKKGNITVNHPRYGEKTCVVTGWKREDKEKTASGQAIFSIQITETLELEVPGKKELSKNDFFAKLAVFVNSAIDAFDAFNSTVDTIANDINTITAIIKGLSAAVENIVASVNSVNDRFFFLERAILESITALVETPDALASALSELFFLPSACAGDGEVSSEDIITAYESTYETIISLAPTPSDSDSFVSSALIVSLTGALTTIAIAETALSGDYETASTAVDTAVSLADFYDTYISDISDLATSGEDNRLSRLFSPDPTQTDSISSAVSDAIRILLLESLNGKKEVIKILNRKYTILDLCYELYGTSDNDTRRFLINTNKLTGQDLIILKSGREIKYYV